MVNDWFLHPSEEFGLPLYTIGNRDKTMCWCYPHWLLTALSGWWMGENSANWVEVDTLVGHTGLPYGVPDPKWFLFKVTFHNDNDKINDTTIRLGRQDNVCTIRHYNTTTDDWDSYLYWDSSPDPTEGSFDSYGKICGAPYTNLAQDNVIDFPRPNLNEYMLFQMEHMDPGSSV